MTMQLAQKKITFVSTYRRTGRLYSQLPSRANVSCLALDELDGQTPGEITVVDIELRDPSQVQIVRQWLNVCPSHDKIIVAIDDEASRIQSIQAHALGATSVVPRSNNWKSIFARLSKTVAEPGASDVPDSLPGFRALGGVFAAVASGKAPEFKAIIETSTEIVAELERSGLDDLLSLIRQHHSQTYQHCMSVTVIAAAFGKHLGFNDYDMKTVALAGLMHDIGKSKIPLEILEKPSKLDDSEESSMRLHPMLGFEMLRNEPEFSGDMLDMVLHHHEYLDGSGYPHGLKGKEISDLTRIITVADVYTALTERRAYKRPLSGIKAFEILRGMDGKLDNALVGEFKLVVRNLV